MMPSWKRNECKCGTSNIQRVSSFTEGREVGFTDEYHRNFKREAVLFNDWIVADEANKDGIIVVQRNGMPCTKFSLHWNWVYLK